jgi:predicted DNA-binding transcriptional regulator AlpA
MAATTTEQLLNVSEVAARLRCSARAVWSWSSSERIPRPMRIGASVRWSERAIDAFIARGCTMDDDAADRKGARR